MFHFVLKDNWYFACNCLPHPCQYSVCVSIQCPKQREREKVGISIAVQVFCSKSDQHVTVADKSSPELLSLGQRIQNLIWGFRFNESFPNCFEKVCNSFLYCLCFLSLTLISWCTVDTHPSQPVGSLLWFRTALWSLLTSSWNCNSLAPCSLGVMLSFTCSY